MDDAIVGLLIIPGFLHVDNGDGQYASGRETFVVCNLSCVKLSVPALVSAPQMTPVSYSRSSPWGSIPPTTAQL